LIEQGNKSPVVGINGVDADTQTVIPVDEGHGRYEPYRGVMTS
jgi:hypothetical protein